MIYHLKFLSGSTQTWNILPHEVRLYHTDKTAFSSTYDLEPREQRRKSFIRAEKRHVMQKKKSSKEKEEKATNQDLSVHIKEGRASIRNFLWEASNILQPSKRSLDDFAYQSVGHREHARIRQAIVSSPQGNPNVTNSKRMDHLIL